MTTYPLLNRDDIATRKTGWGDTRVSINVYSIQRRDGIDFRSATRRAEAIAAYTDDARDIEAIAASLIATANQNRHLPL